jgi:hypothetical protein
VKNKASPIPIIFILLVSCGPSLRQLGDNYYQFVSTYPNGKIRTLFCMKNGNLCDSLEMISESGKIDLYHRAPGVIADSQINYRRIQDSATALRSVRSVNKGFHDFLKYTYINYRPLFEDGDFNVWFQLAFWVNEDGMVEHAVCVHSSKCTPQVIQSFIEDLEKWRFEPEKGTRLTFVYKAVNAHVLDQHRYY